MTAQVPGFYCRRVGSLTVAAVNDGTIDLPPAALVGMDPADVATLLQSRLRSLRSAVNTFLVQGGGRTILIDTGAGSAMGPTMGRLLPNLAAAGVRPEDVDLILLTHLHRDHAGGLATPGGAPVFPRATLAVHETDAAFWLDQAPEACPEAIRATVIGAQTSAKPYRQLARLTTDAAPGITAIPLPGHTPGHTGYRIDDGADSLLIWGDIIHVPDIQSAHPEVGIVFDIDAAQAIATRRRVLDMAATDRIAIAGMHLHYPPFAHIIRAAGAYEVIPELWQPVV